MYRCCAGWQSIVLQPLRQHQQAGSGTEGGAAAVRQVWGPAGSEGAGGGAAAPAQGQAGGTGHQQGGGDRKHRTGVPRRQVTGGHVAADVKR